MVTLTIKPRELSPDRDWMFFDPYGPISPEDRSRIRPLELESARSVWEEFVSRDAREDHPMLLPRGHWLGELAVRGPDWQESWDRQTAPDPLVEFLRSHIDWPDEAEVFFIWNNENAVSLEWGVFLRSWRNFLYSDEGPFLIRPDRPEFVWFSPNPLMGIGRRS